jgi:dipeptidyl aminopeptidase/acylaminoacyl peptidase
MTLATLTLTLLPALIPLQDAPAAPSDVLELMDVFELEMVNDPQISPDGKQVVFVRSSMDVLRDRPRSRLWITDVEGESMRPVGSDEAGAGSPRWSPDGTRLAYNSVSNGSNQIHLRYMDTGESFELSHLPKSPGSLTWSPDGKWPAARRAQGRQVGKSPARD